MRRSTDAIGVDSRQITFVEAHCTTALQNFECKKTKHTSYQASTHTQSSPKSCYHRIHRTKSPPILHSRVFDPEARPIANQSRKGKNRVSNSDSSPSIASSWLLAFYHDSQNGDMSVFHNIPVGHNDRGVHRVHLAKWLRVPHLPCARRRGCCRAWMPLSGGGEACGWEFGGGGWAWRERGDGGRTWCLIC